MLQSLLLSRYGRCKVTKKLYNIRNGERVARNREFHLVMGKLHAVDAAAILLITRARVAGEGAAQCGEGIGIEACGKRFGNYHIEHFAFLRVRVGESACSIGVAVGVGQIGLNVVDRSAVHQVGASHYKHWRIGAIVVYAYEPHRGQAYSIRSEGRASGKDAHASVAAQARRANRGRPSIALRFGKIP